MTESTAAVPQRLRVHRTSEDVVVLQGEIDLATAPELRAALDAAAAPGVRQTVDLRDITYLDSAGLSVLYDHGARLHLLVAPASVVSTVIEISGLAEATSVELRAPES